MRFHDISGLIVCGAFYILPFAIIIGFALSRVWKDIRWRKKVQFSDRLEKYCKDCSNLYLGADYLRHCDITENLGPTICNPDSRWCWRMKH